MFLKAKLRDLRVTGAQLEYEGSITIDRNYLDKAGIAPYEEVQVLNLNNGSRITTYAIAGTPGSGIVELNGPAARSGIVGDRVIVLTYCLLTDEEAARHVPRVISVTSPGGR